MALSTLNNEEGTKYIISFRKAKKLYKKYIEHDLQKYALSKNEIEIIMYLTRNEGNNTARDIAKYLNVSKGMISRNLEQLLAKGILEIQKDKVDKRISRLKLSSGAESLTKDLEKSSDKFFRGIVAGISEEKLETFAGVLEDMILNLKDFE